MLNINRKERWKAKVTILGALLVFAVAMMLALYGVVHIIWGERTQRQLMALQVENRDLRTNCRWAALLETRLPEEAKDTLDAVDETVRQWREEQ